MVINNCINKLGEFLAIRDIDKLSQVELQNKFNIEQVDVLILLGNAIPYTISVAVEAYRLQLCKRIMICGGIGHSTENLRNKIISLSRYNDIDVKDKSEGDIFKDIMVKHYNVDEKVIIVENISTNCGDNAKKAIEMLDDLEIEYNSILLIQDPTMQLRSCASFKKYIKNKDVKIINYAPFIPKVDKELNFINNDIEGIWDIDRYLELIIGEVPRLRDNEEGYGPKGKNFINHVDITEDIENVYLQICTKFKNTRQI